MTQEQKEAEATLSYCALTGEAISQIMKRRGITLDDVETVLAILRETHRCLVLLKRDTVECEMFIKKWETIRATELN